MFQFVAVVVLCSFISSNALYSKGSKVVQVSDEKQFKQEVTSYGGVAIVEFYAPWCGHCKNLVPEFDKAASILNGVVKLVAVDATVAQAVAQKYQVQGYPTLKVFGADKKAPTEYQGGRTSDAIVSEGMKMANKLVKDRKAGKAGGKEKTESSSQEKTKPKAKKAGASDVVTLTDANFDKLVMASNDHWLVEFYAPWCGHCKSLAPHWEEAATTLKSQNVKLGAVDATENNNLAQRFEIQGFPSIKIFTAGLKGKAVDYNGPREAEGIIQYALDSLEKANVPLVIKQITSTSVFEDVTTSKLSAILFLPHILDSGASGRNSYLSQFEEVAKGFRKMPFSFSWTEANAQSELEEALLINGNFPTLAVVSAEKKIFATNKLSWSIKNLKDFMNGVLSGTEKVSALKDSKINKVDSWDGNDGHIESEEMSLEDLFGDD